MGVPTLHVLPTVTVAPLPFAVSGCVLAQGLEMAGIRKAAPALELDGPRTSPAQELSTPPCRALLFSLCFGYLLLFPAVGG